MNAIHTAVVMLLALASSTPVGAGAAVPAPPNYQGLWWNAPAGSESGWGLNLAHQADTIFTTWFTYDTGGKAVWFAMTAQKTGTNSYSGKLYSTRGPAFNAQFDPKVVVATEVGRGTLSFTDADNGTFSYTLGSVSQAKAITRQVFGTLPVCVYADSRATYNLTDMWWASPAASESGWGIALSHQGDQYFASTILAVWFTYDSDGSPTWLTVTAFPYGDDWGEFFGYSGTLYRTSGARFDAFRQGDVVVTKVGRAEFNVGFALDVVGAPAGFDTPVGFSRVLELAGTYHGGGTSITREIFAAPGTTCR